MSRECYAIIDGSNNIINKVVYYSPDGPPDPDPHPAYPNCTFVRCDNSVGMQSDGWLYVDQQFVPPPPAPIQEQLPTLTQVQEQMTLLQSQLNKLLAQ